MHYELSDHPYNETMFYNSENTVYSMKELNGITRFKEEE